MKQEIRTATREDMPRVLELIQELAHFEKEPDAVQVTVADLIKEGFSDQPLFQCFVGLLDGRIEGIALCYPRFSTWKGRTIHLEDLIVSEKYRGVGLGKALYNEVLKYAYNQQVRRVEWVVLDWNHHAIEFYKSTGAEVSTEWNIVQMDEQSLAQYVSNL
jgi:GNAT superfamily N-acetyltransferase